MNNKRVTVYKKLNISSAHVLQLDYESKCNTLHGHNYKIEVWVTGELNNDGMVVDFNHIKKICKELDHININDKIMPSTAENIAIYLADNIEGLGDFNKVLVRVWETDTCYAERENR